MRGNIYIRKYSQGRAIAFATAMAQQAVIL
jgi:hypothetical protein